MIYLTSRPSGECFDTLTSPSMTLYDGFCLLSCHRYIRYRHPRLLSVQRLRRAVTFEINMSQVIHPGKSSVVLVVPINLGCSSSQLNHVVGGPGHVIQMANREKSCPIRIVSFYCYYSHQTDHLVLLVLLMLNLRTFSQSNVQI